MFRKERQPTSSVAMFFAGVGFGILCNIVVNIIWVMYGQGKAIKICLITLFHPEMLYFLATGRNTGVMEGYVLLCSYYGVWFVIFHRIVLFIRRRREADRRRIAVAELRCPQCAYDLKGNTSCVCPECGEPAASSAIACELALDEPSS